VFGVPNRAGLREVVALEIDRLATDPEIVMLPSLNQVGKSVVENDFARQRVAIVVTGDADNVAIRVFAFDTSLRPLKCTFVQNKW
jgi:hypothetical protein